MAFVQTKSGLEFYYEIEGRGENLLFLIGTEGDLQRHKEVSPFSSDLPRWFEILAYDERGLGSSAKPQKNYTMGDYAEDAVEVLEALGWDTAFVVGYSFGGMVAQELGIRHPERIRRLVLLSTSSGGDGGSSFPLHEFVDMPSTDRLVRLMELTDTRRSASWRKEHPDEVNDWMREWEDFEAVTAEVDGQPGGSLRQLAARKQHDTYDRLRQLRMPVLVVAGTADGIAPPENQRAMASQIDGAQLAFFEGGHRVLWENPDAETEIRRFLQDEHE